MEQNDILGPSVGYTDLLDFEIKEEIKRQHGKRKYPLRPSSAGYCGRRLAYEFSEFLNHKDWGRKPTDEIGYRIFKIGDAVEASSIEQFALMKSLKHTFQQEPISIFEIDRIDGKEVIEGSCDLVLLSESYKCVMDVKSKKDGFSRAFRTRWDEDIDNLSGLTSLFRLSQSCFYANDLMALVKELGSDFLVDNLLQLNLYACSPKVKALGVDHAFIYRYNKNDSRHLEIRFRPSEECVNLVREKFNRVAYYVDKKQVEGVAKDFTLGSVRCAFCPYSVTCHDDNALKAWYKTLPGRDWPKDLRESSELNQALLQYDELTEGTDRLKAIHEECVKLFEKENHSKVKLTNQKVYELKYLKSPKPHFEIRPSK